MDMFGESLFCFIYSFFIAHFFKKCQLFLLPKSSENCLFPSLLDFSDLMINHHD